MIKLVIFDFDGTVVDSKQVYYNSIGKHLGVLGVDKGTIERTIDLGLSLSDTLKKFVPFFIYRWWIRRKIMRDVMEEAGKVKKCHDAGHIKEIKLKKILVSNSLSEFVMPVLKHLRLGGLFKEVYCADDFDNKTHFIKTYLKLRGIRPNEVFYVGDRVADVILAKKIGVHSLIVSGKCAWNSQKEIVSANPEFIVPDLRDVKRIAEGFRD